MNFRILIVFLLIFAPIIAWSQGKGAGTNKPTPAKAEKPKNAKSDTEPNSDAMPNGYANLEFEIETKRTAVLKSGRDASGEVIIPSSVIINNVDYAVTYIRAGAFSDCSGPTSVTIPNSVTKIGRSAFNGCRNLSDINVDVNNRFYSSLDGVLFNKDKSSLIKYPESRKGSYIIPDSVTSIGDGAFQGCSGLTSVTIPNSVTSIGDWAFKNCSGLTSVTIPNSVTSIGNFAFAKCSALTSVTIPNSVTKIGWSAFEGCSGLTSVTIPNSATSIEDFAFINCWGLTSVTIPTKFKSRVKEIFDYCSNLKTINYTN